MCFKEKMVTMVSIISVLHTKSHQIPGELPYKERGVLVIPLRDYNRRFSAS